MTTRYGPGSGKVTVSLIRPFAPIGGWWWMITDRSQRTMIRWTPLCGPAPCLYCVSGFPSGWTIVNDTRVGVPAFTGRAGVNPERAYVCAAPPAIVGAVDP